VHNRSTVFAGRRQCGLQTNTRFIPLAISAVFTRPMPHSPYTQQRAGPFLPEISPFPWEIWTPRIHGCRPTIPNGISIASAILPKIHPRCHRTDRTAYYSCPCRNLWVKFTSGKTLTQRTELRGLKTPRVLRFIGEESHKYRYTKSQEFPAFSVHAVL